MPKKKLLLFLAFFFVLIRFISLQTSLMGPNHLHSNENHTATAVEEGISGTSMEAPDVGILKLSGQLINQKKKGKKEKKRGKKGKQGKNEGKKKKEKKNSNLICLKIAMITNFLVIL